MGPARLVPAAQVTHPGAAPLTHHVDLSSASSTAAAHAAATAAAPAFAPSSADAFMDPHVLPSNSKQPAPAPAPAPARSLAGSDVWSKQAAIVQVSHNSPLRMCTLLIRCCCRPYTRTMAA